MRYMMIFVSILFLGCGGNDDEVSSKEIVKKDVAKKDTPHKGSTNPKAWYKPTSKTTWQWQLEGTINQSYDVNVYDIDLFETKPSVIKELQESGKKVICYFSAGSYEDWRKDAKDFPKEIIGKQLEGWDGENWLDISSDRLKPIMKARLDIAKQKGCDGVEPDNVDGYTNKSGFNITSNDQLNYNKFLAKEAHSRGLSIGLKNDVDQVKDLEPFFDFTVNEECHQYKECGSLKPFIIANKPVFNAEYKHDKKDEFCKEALLEGFQTLILPLELDDSFHTISCN